MNKPRYMSGPVGAVALCALVAVLGAPFFTHQMELIGGKGDSANISMVKSATSNGVKADMNAASDAEYLEKIKKENAVRAKQAEMTGASNMPLIIGAAPQNAPQQNTAQQDTLALPVAPPVPHGDPLQEWRAKPEARRLSLEEAAPAAKELKKTAAPAPIPATRPARPATPVRRDAGRN